MGDDLGGILLLISAWMKRFGPQFPPLYQYRQDLFSTGGKAGGNQLFTMFANQCSVRRNTRWVREGSVERIHL